MYARFASSISTNLRNHIRSFSSQNNNKKEFQIQIDDDSKLTHTINYIQKGNGSNAVILLPGALGSALTDFLPQIEQLPKLLDNFSIVAWDPPGYGKSRPPERTFPNDFFHRDAFVANALMQQLGFRKYSVLGWSDGGITGLIMAAKYTNAIEKLVIWGSNSYVLPEELDIYESIRDVSKWSKKMREPMEQVYGVEYFPKLWSAWVDGFQKLYDANSGNICKDELHKIQAETLILHGLKDPMIASEHIPFLRKAIKSNQYYEFPDGKHNIHLRYANEFNSIVSKFLSS